MLVAAAARCPGCLWGMMEEEQEQCGCVGQRLLCEKCEISESLLMAVRENRL